jgi:hypothetical protein
MKKSISLLSIALLVFTSMLITGCKKGEDDPFISLRSRDARITAKWKLTKAEEISTFISAGTTYTSTSNYNGTVYTEAYSSGVVDSYSYAFEMEILKDGVMTYTRTNNGDVYSAKTIWYWLNSTSDKTRIRLSGIGAQGFDAQGFNVQRLSSNELILNIEGEYSETDIEQETEKYSATWTFEKID